MRECNTSVERELREGEESEGGGRGEAVQSKGGSYCILGAKTSFQAY